MKSDQEFLAGIYEKAERLPSLDNTRRMQPFSRAILSMAATAACLCLVFGAFLLNDSSPEPATFKEEVSTEGVATANDSGGMQRFVYSPIQVTGELLSINELPDHYIDLTLNVSKVTDGIVDDEIVIRISEKERSELVKVKQVISVYVVAGEEGYYTLAGGSAIRVGE